MNGGQNALRVGKYDRWQKYKYRIVMFSTSHQGVKTNPKLYPRIDKTTTCNFAIEVK